MKLSVPDRSIEDLEQAVIGTLVPLADPARARWIHDYMRGKFEFLGIATPVRRSATLPLLRSFEPVNAAGLLRAARHFWKMKERDYRWVALDLLDCHRSLLGVRHVPALLELVQQESWWDTVDSLAGLIGSIVRQDRAAGQRLMDRAVQSENLWVRRVAMLHQLGWRGETDSRRLFGYAERLAPDQDFFIRKAIGWALRDYAKHDRRAVESFIRRARTGLSLLSRREALRTRTQMRAETGTTARDQNSTAPAWGKTRLKQRKNTKTRTTEST